jgi:hypothetical protein
MWTVWLLTLSAVVAAVPAWAQAPQVEQRTVFINEHQVFEPGYPIGNLVIGSPEIADYKVMPDRRQLLIFGKGAGKTSFTIWDQKNVKRHEIVISVMTREDAQAEADLRDLLKDFPNVGVRRVRGELVITGTVDTEQDLEAVERIASVGGAQNLARVSPRWARPQASPAPGTAPGAATSAAPGAARAPAPVLVYAVELMEASSQFRSGSYETGTQPSGPTLFKGDVMAPPGQEGVLMIPASAVFARDPSKVPKGESGIRLRFRPAPPERSGALLTHVTVETNLPVDAAANDSSIWRRSRWEVSVTEGLPFAIAGADLLAVVDPNAPAGSATLGRLGNVAETASTVGGMPGVSNAPAVGAAGGVIGAVRDLFGLWGTQSGPPPTHLLVLVRPQMIAGGGGK